MSHAPWCLFGASGDLAKRKVIPAMFDLATHGSLGPQYAIVGFARTPMSDESFRASLGEAAKSIRKSGRSIPTSGMSLRRIFIISRRIWQSGRFR